MILSVNSLDTAKLGTLLSVWYVGGEHKFVKRPFDPYFYSSIKMHNATPITLTDLATMQALQMWKVQFSNTGILKENTDEAFTTEDDVPYVQRVAIDEGFSYPSELPRHYAFDIETDKVKHVTSVSFFGNKVESVNTGSDEKDNILFINREIKDHDPDLLDTYWGSYFDVNVLALRAKHHGITLKWGRDSSTPYITKRKYHRGPKEGVENTVKIEGRLHFDIWKEVDADQTLSGIKDKRLKTVAKWFKLPPPIIEVDYDNMDKLSKDELAEYNLNDSRLSWLLAEMYLRRLYYFCETMALPLNLLIERTPSHLPNYLYMQDMRRLGIIARQNNQERFPQFFDFERKAYQGALVKLYRAGIYKNVRKADFKSMYPTIMACFNLGPETVHLLSVKHQPCTGFEIPQFKDDEITIYDNKVGVFKVKIDETESTSRAHIKEWTAYRQTVKEKLKARPNDPALESAQYGIKVNMNQIYGYHGMRYARYGSAPIAAIVTAIGRWWMWETVRFLEMRGVTEIIESDTDGVYYIGSDLSKEITQHIQSLVPLRYDASMITVEDEFYDNGIFYEEKGYILKAPNKTEPLIHGSGLKGRHLPPICDRATEILTKGIFEGKDLKQILYGFAHLKGYPLTDFAMTVELHKEYYAEKTMQRKMIDMANKFGQEYAWGSEIKYVKCKDGYMPYGLQREYRIDYAYYRSRLVAVLSRILGPTKKISKETIEKIIKEGQSVIA